MTGRIVLAYSGDLDGCIAIAWLREQYDADVITVTLDLGQERGLEEIRDRAIAAGAVRAHALDVREEFAREYILPALQGGAVFEGVVGQLSRPLIARKLVEIAAIEETTDLAHGCTEPHDRMRLETRARELNAQVRIIAPASEWNMSEAGKITYARDRRLPAIPARRTPGFTRPAADASALVDIAFERGVPVAISGIPMTLTELMESVAIIGAPADGRESIYEAPAFVLQSAYAALQVSYRNGQSGPTGIVRMSLSNGAHTVVGCATPEAEAAWS
jgi:argininosuccinate synthase